MNPVVWDILKLVLLIWLTMMVLYLWYTVQDIVSVETLSTTGTTTVKRCDAEKVTFLYSPYCGHCKRQLEDGSLEILEDMGISLTKVNVVENNISIPYVPGWRFDNKEEYGYKMLNELKEMFGCD